MANQDVWQVRAIFDNSSTNEQLSFGFHFTESAGGAPSASDIGPHVVDWWDTGADAVKQYTPSTMSLAQVNLRRVVPFDASMQTYNVGLPIAGTATGDMYASQASPLINLRTALIGRRYRGRMYLPPLSEVNVGPGGEIGLTVAENIRDQTSAMFAAIEGELEVDKVVVFSQAQLDNPVGSADYKNAVTSVRIDRILRTQRRRADESPEYV